MQKDLEYLNSSLKKCLQKGLTQPAKVNSRHYAKLQKVPKKDLEAIIDNPILFPVSALYAVSEALGVTHEMFKIITSYELK